MDTQQQDLLKKPKILVIGDSCEDVYHYGRCERLSPEAPIPILKLIRSESKSGMCLNVAKNLQGLGLNVDVITQNEPIKKSRYVEEKRLVHLLRVDEEQKNITPIDVEKVKNFLCSNDYDAVVISDYNKGFLSNSSCSKIIEIIDNKIPVFVDSKKHDLSCFHNCIIKINKSENDLVTSLPSTYELIVTIGEDGAIWKGKHYPTNKSKLYDVCGAGDTFLAALAYEYLRTVSLDDAILYANKCASISVTHFGNFVIGQTHV